MNSSGRTMICGTNRCKEGAEPTPKVSVCVVTYNQVNYIECCLQSLVDQAIPFSIEVIVADDCSTDGTTEVVRAYSERYPNVVRPIFRHTNIGWERNYLEVHAVALGEYVAHMDGDDYALPGKLHAQSAALDRDERCNAVWHRMDFFDDNGAFCSGYTADISSFPNGRVEFSDAARLGFIGAHSSLMYRKSARSVTVDFDRPALDMRMMLELLSSGHGRMLDVVYGRYRVASSGSVVAASVGRIHRLALGHAREFLARCPQHRRDFMIWALSSSVITAKSRQAIAVDYLQFAWTARSWVSPWDIVTNLRRRSRAKVRWRAQRPKSKSQLVQDA